MKPKLGYDLSGQRFGRWTVLRREPRKAANSYWLCHCDCGTERVICRVELVKGDSVSCGCHMEGVPHPNLRHGQSSTPEYWTWQRIRDRCYNPACHKFPQYGGRGITVCDRWHIFENFLSDMGKRPTGKTSIGRIDNDGNYEPSNCQWESHLEQSKNKTTSVLLTYKGETMNVVDWSRRLGVNIDLIASRLRKGMTPEECFETPIRGHGNWSLKHHACILCGGTDSEHQGFGFCRRCSAKNK